MRHAKEYKRGSRAKAAIFFTVLILGMVISLIPPLHPSESLAEGRSLTEFPEFSTTALLSGEYFHGVDDWFADTFPFRDTFFQLNHWLRSFYGFKTVEIHGQVTQGDEIPDKPFTGK